MADVKKSGVPCEFSRERELAERREATLSNGDDVGMDAEFNCKSAPHTIRSTPLR